MHTKYTNIYTIFSIWYFKNPNVIQKSGSHILDRYILNIYDQLFNIRKTKITLLAYVICVWNLFYDCNKFCDYYFLLLLNNHTFLVHFYIVNCKKLSKCCCLNYILFILSYIPKEPLYIIFNYIYIIIILI